MTTWWAWTIIVGGWSLAISLLLLHLEASKYEPWGWVLILTFFIFLGCLVFAGVLSTVEYLMWMQAWPFEAK
jgi:hypothetical protein